MRVWIGGIETIVPARWFFCSPGAKEFFTPHGGEASPFLKENEVNREWGEVTPEYRGFPGKLDRGINPGYAGQCFIGDPQWFRDGRLPADFLSLPAQNYPLCCRKPAGLGELILGGGGTPSQGTHPIGFGDLILGNQLLAWQPGHLVLLGGAVPYQAPPQPSGSGSGSGSGGEDDVPCSECPDGAARQFAATIAGVTDGTCFGCDQFNGTVTFTYVGGCSWTTGVIPCATGGEVILSIAAGQVTVAVSSIGNLWQAAQGGWDCRSPKVLPRVNTYPECLNLPASITLEPI